MTLIGMYVPGTFPTLFLLTANSWRQSYFLWIALNSVSLQLYHWESFRQGGSLPPQPSSEVPVMKLLLGLASPSLFAYITGEIEIKDKDRSSV